MGSVPVSLPLSELVDVIVYVSPQLPPQPTFNQGLIIGPSTAISTDDRVKKYFSADAMLQDGFTINDPEYKSAVLYFSQNPAPQVLWVGRQDVSNNETLLEAVVACRAANYNWWGFYACGALQNLYIGQADHEALAGWAETASPAVCYFYNTQDANIPDDSVGLPGNNVFAALKQSAYSRAIGIFSTTGGSAHPNNAYAGAALMGMAMGLNTGQANSYFTLKFKQLRGITVEPLTATQVQNIENVNGNLYLNYGNAYTIFEQGVLANGQFFDEVLNLDMIASDMQYTLIDLLVSNNAIPMTDPGETQLINGVNAACERARTRGFVAAGVWTGQQLLNLKPGDSMPNGYLAQAQPYSVQSQADRTARKAMPIYVAILESGAAHSITVGVFVQR